MAREDNPVCFPYMLESALGVEPSLPGGLLSSGRFQPCAGQHVSGSHVIRARCRHSVLRGAGDPPWLSQFLFLSGEAEEAFWRWRLIGERGGLTPS